jgi:oxygen-independent coproporphyrinogen-3 oxidase
MSLPAGPGVYLHLPFCPYLCPYCDFAKRPWKASESARYLAALRAEIAASPPVPAATLFVGGGTPNTLPAAEFASLLELVRERFGLPARAEVTVEVNPDAPLIARIPAFVAAGATRVSVGVQSFVDAELATLGRRHAAAGVAEAVRLAREAGARRISLDLIFGVPGQTRASWTRSLEAALALEPDHISTYGLTVEEGTPYWRWRERDPQAFLASDDEADLYAMAIETLRSAGFEHYEISNFARPGGRCAHNENYWRNGEYLGFGMGAASYRGGIRSVNTRDFAAYCEAALTGSEIPAERESLDAAGRVAEATMLALRTADGVDLAEFERRYDVRFLDHFAPVVAELRASGLISVEPPRVALTERGRFLANDVCGAFVTYAR